MTAVYGSLPFDYHHQEPIVCPIHGRARTKQQDGTDHWVCDECIVDALYRADVLADHAAGRCQRYAVCPFCEPEGDHA